MSNNGSFVPLAVGGNEQPRQISKPALGHVVSFPTSSGVVNYGSETGKEKYKWHTVVDGFSKSLFPLILAVTTSSFSSVGNICHKATARSTPKNRPENR